LSLGESWWQWLDNPYSRRAFYWIALKLPIADYRNQNGGLDLHSEPFGFYWTSSSLSYGLFVSTSRMQISGPFPRVFWAPVRCFKN
jgi:hypothetical protein